LKNSLKKCKNICDFIQKNNCSGSYQINFSTQADLFYSHQSNETIFKVDKWGKSHEKSLQTFYSFCEKLCVSMPTFQHDIHFIQLRTERFFNTDWLILFIPMSWNHFQSCQMGKTLRKIITNFIAFAKNCASPWKPFSVIFIPSGSEQKDFSTQTDWFYSYQCNETIFKVDKWGKVMKSHYKLLKFLWKIVCRYGNFSAWYSFHPAQNGRIFQQRLIYFIHTNAMNPFSKLTNGEKVMKNRYKCFIHLWKIVRCHDIMISDWNIDEKKVFSNGGLNLYIEGIAPPGMTEWHQYILEVKKQQKTKLCTNGIAHLLVPAVRLCTLAAKLCLLKITFGASWFWAVFSPHNKEIAKGIGKLNTAKTTLHDFTQLLNQNIYLWHHEVRIFLLYTIICREHSTHQQPYVTSHNVAENVLRKDLSVSFTYISEKIANIMLSTIKATKNKIYYILTWETKCLDKLAVWHYKIQFLISFLILDTWYRTNAIHNAAFKNTKIMQMPQKLQITTFFSKTK